MSRFQSPLDTWDSDRRQLYAWARDVSKRFVFGSFTWNPPSVGATTTVDTTLTTTDTDQVTGLREGMEVHVTPPSDLTAGLIVGAAWCPDTDELTIRLGNVTAAPINQGSGTWVFRAFAT